MAGFLVKERRQATDLEVGVCFLNERLLVARMCCEMKLNMDLAVLTFLDSVIHVL